MATSLTSPSLVFAADTAILAARKALAKAKYFTTDFSADAVQPGSTMKIPVFAATAETFDADNANYEHSTGSVTWASVTFGNHVKGTYEFTDRDFTLAPMGSFWKNAGDDAGRAIAASIMGTVGGLINKTNIPKTGTGTAANEVVFSVTKANLAGLRDKCAAAGIDPGQCALLLNPAQFAAALALLDANVYGGSEAIRNGVVEGLYGFAAVVECTTLTTTATEYLLGAIIPKDGLAIAGRVVPVGSPSAYQEIGTTTDEDSGLVLGLRRHGNPATGSNFLNVEALFGAAIVQPGKCIRLVSQATA